MLCGSSGRREGRFERLVRRAFETHPYEYGPERFEHVWLWSEWPERTATGYGADIGIDLVAKQTPAYGGGLCAIQCKNYAATHKVPTSGVDSFLAASGAEHFSSRILVVTSDAGQRLLSNSGRGARDRVGGCGRIGGMQGTEKPDRELLDALGLCGALVREGSVHRFLAEHRLRLFPDGLFADLFGGRGRPSVPGSVIAVVMVLQALEGCSDREAVERLRCDVRWKAAAGLGIDDEGFDASVLTLWRQRLRASERPERIFDAVREVAAECGALSKGTRRALDSTVLYDAVATQDTVTMIGAQIRRVRKLAPQTAALVLARDYDSRAKPVCDWGDPDERAWLIDELVTDAQRVLDALAGSELSDEQAQAAALLAVVAGQDVEADPKVPGRWRIARRVAKDRVISTVDPEARHARKSRSRRRDRCRQSSTAQVRSAPKRPAQTFSAWWSAVVVPQVVRHPSRRPSSSTATTVCARLCASIPSVIMIMLPFAGER